ncbi:hypothetical protein Hanom_Chr04g00292191 [Helianthus anomalus]
MANLGPVSRALTIAFVQGRGSLRRISPHVMNVMPFSSSHLCVQLLQIRVVNHGSTPYHHQHKD